VIIAFSDASKT
jgi:hypothetical protein